jgi:DNA polymerase-3 subunit epsilon/DNA polymerase-3 subunit alpha (Gram-positive type)
MTKEIFTFIDFETTGLDHNEEQVIEVAAIKTDLEREYGRYHVLVALKDGKELPQFSKDTGFSEEMLAGGANELGAMLGLAGFIGNDTVVAHYAPFDFAYLNNFGLEPSFFLCTRSIERILHPTESASLAPTCERYGIKLEGAHRAMNDLEATVEVLKAQLAEGEKQGMPRRNFANLIIDSEERPNRFTPKHARVKKM